MLIALLMLVLAAPAPATFEPGEGAVVEPDALEVRIGPTNPRLRRSEVTKVLIRCDGGPPQSSCAGAVLIGISNSHHPMAFGSVRYKLASGSEKLVEVPMKPRARAALEREPDRRRPVVVTATQEAGFPAIRRLILSY
jgi:hypothetical protein